MVRPKDAVRGLAPTAATTATASVAAAPAAATATTTTAAAPPSAAAVAGAGAFLALASLVDSERPALKFLAMKHGYGGLGFCVASHFDKAEPARFLRHPVLNDVD